MKTNELIEKSKTLDHTTKKGKLEIGKIFKTIKNEQKYSLVKFSKDLGLNADTLKDWVAAYEAWVLCSEMDKKELTVTNLRELRKVQRKAEREKSPIKSQPIIKPKVKKIEKIIEIKPKKLNLTEENLLTTIYSKLKSGQYKEKEIRKFMMLSGLIMAEAKTRLYALLEVSEMEPEVEEDIVEDWNEIEEEQPMLINTELLKDDDAKSFS
jgi:hypothetical protein